METVDITSLKVKAGDYILDLGCGEGRHSIASAFHFPNAYVVGLDLDFNSLATAQKKHSEFAESSNHKHIADEKKIYMQGSGDTLPFSDASFDHIICSEVLEHVHNFTSFLTEIKRVLKPKGSLCVSVPRAWPERICWALSHDYYNVPGGHIRIFSEKALTSGILNQDFIFKRKHWAHALHTPYWWLRCLIWNKGQENILSGFYHRFLVWDLLKKPALTRHLEALLNPILGKSVVLYFEKENI